MRIPVVGYVSDAWHSAIAGAHVEFSDHRGIIWSGLSSASGAVLASINPGNYQATVSCPSYTSVRTRVEVGPQPVLLRLNGDDPLGYVWPRWVRAGETSEFRVHATEAYRLSLHRYGLEKTFIKLLGWFDEHGPRAMTQSLPTGDFVSDGVGWNRQGYESSVHSQSVIAPPESGLYYFHAETESGAEFTFPWVVAPARPTAPIAVVLATNTWNAYNNFGGRSNYVLTTGLPNEPIVSARHDMIRYTHPKLYGDWQHDLDPYPPLSFERPEPFNHIPSNTRVKDPIRGRQPCHLAPAEWRLLAWLEREGFAYDVYSEQQLHDGILDPADYRALILGPHPEYWSAQMFDRVHHWVHHEGGRLAYLGGNGLNGEVTYPEKSCMSVRTHWQPDIHIPQWESRMHRTHRPEASLLGVAFTDSGAMTAAPYRVVDPLPPLFDGTGLKVGDEFGRQSQHERYSGGASGHETDKLTASSPKGTHILAKGLNPDEGGAEMVTFETESGGRVFSTGSITWCACLLVDEHVSRITANAVRYLLD